MSQILGLGLGTDAITAIAITGGVVLALAATKLFKPTNTKKTRVVCLL
uniref:Uncharacterized protein n=1 Tax=viral metagenome TaxID=1070528 RepID=A0A6C0HWF8_9ZZZZ